MQIRTALALVFTTMTLIGCRTGAVSESKVDSKLAKPVVAAQKVTAPDAPSSEARTSFSQDPSNS